MYFIRIIISSSCNIIPENIQFSLIFYLIRHFWSETYARIDDLIIGDVLPEICRATIGKEGCLLAGSLTRRRQTEAYCNRFTLKKFALPPPFLSSGLWATAISFNETSNRSYGTLGWSSLRPLAKVFSLFVPNYRHRGSCGSPRVESGSGGR